MTKLEKKLLRFVKANRGITLEKLSVIVVKDISSVRKTIRTLHLLGYVSYWKVGVYPNRRSLEVFEKGKNDLYNEIGLENHLTPKQIGKFIKHSDDDPWYCCTYLIDEEDKTPFEKTNNVNFDLEKFEYWLTYTLDNRDDVSKHLMRQICCFL